MAAGKDKDKESITATLSGVPSGVCSGTEPSTGDMTAAETGAARGTARGEAGVASAEGSAANTGLGKKKDEGDEADEAEARGVRLEAGAGAVPSAAATEEREACVRRAAAARSFSADSN